LRSLQDGEAKKGTNQNREIPEGRVYVDLTGKGQGRGAYVCDNIDCIELARKKDLLSKALKVEVPREVYEELLKKVAETEGAGQ